ncbi:ANTAR domain-containing protein [Streptomyces sp. NPDC002755]|uniref:ANTAR domain-containing protein n=1 Tax=Streptomyces sp. NPDC002884 TaxID=3154544 RepID=UPI003328FF68
MTTSRVPRHLSDGMRNATVAGLEQENAQLRHALGSHATVDQAVGVLAAIHRIRPAAGFEVLRQVSQQTNIKLHTVAEMVIAWALGQPLPQTVGHELGEAVQRRSRSADAPDQPHWSSEGFRACSRVKWQVVRASMPVVRYLPLRLPGGSWGSTPVTADAFLVPLGRWDRPRGPVPCIPFSAEPLLCSSPRLPLLWVGSPWALPASSLETARPELLGGACFFAWKERWALGLSCW